MTHPLSADTAGQGDSFHLGTWAEVVHFNIPVQSELDRLPSKHAGPQMELLKNEEVLLLETKIWGAKAYVSSVLAGYLLLPQYLRRVC